MSWTWTGFYQWKQEHAKLQELVTLNMKPWYLTILQNSLAEGMTGWRNDCLKEWLAEGMTAWGVIMCDDQHITIQLGDNFFYLLDYVTRRSEKLGFKKKRILLDIAVNFCFWHHWKSLRKLLFQNTTQLW